ncbi:MAG: T9SS type A sorting domain-containing protein [Bacteroidales bacterium]|jgi:hypothetical protein
MKRSAFFHLKELAAILSVLFLFSSILVTANTFTSFENAGPNGFEPTLNSGKQVSEFRFNDLNPDAIGLIDQVSSTITVHVPFSQAVNSLTAYFTLSPLARAYVGGLLQTSGQTVNNFTSPVTYQIIAQDGTTRTYSVSVVKDRARSLKVLEAFSFQGLVPAVEGVIDQNLHTVMLHVPYSTTVTGLVATFSNSFLSQVRIDGIAQISGMTANNFSTNVIYTVVAEDGSSQNYVVTVIKNDISTARQMTDFRFIGLSAEAIGIIDESAGTIAVTVPWLADYTNLAASFTSSPGSTVKVGTAVQVSGTTRHNFSSPVIYSVMAENGEVKAYTVTVSRAALGTANSILTFNFETQFEPDIIGTIDQTAKTINLSVPNSQVITGLVATFTCSRSAALIVNSTIQTSGITANDFTFPVSYFCRAEDGSAEIYIVTISRLPATSNKLLTDFRFILPDYTAIGVINQTNGTVIIHVPYGTDITYLAGSFTVSPLSRLQVQSFFQVSGETPQNFTNPVIYRVIAEDYSEAAYTISVVVDPSREKQLLTFAFNGLVPPVSGAINETAKTIQVNVPYSTSRSSLVASFTQSLYATVFIGSAEQISGVTANNFTSPKTYTVKAQDNSTQNYLVTVSNSPPSNEAKITDFRFAGFPVPAVGTIDENAGTISIVIPYSAPSTNLIASFSHSPFSSVRIGTVAQVSGVTPNNFTNPVTYQVIAESGAVRNYVVTVVKGPLSGEKSILSFNFEAQFEPDIVGVINEAAKTITLTVPFTQDVTGLIPTFISSPYSRVLVGTVYQVSGVTAQNFTNTVSYLCEAENGTRELYHVSILRGPASSMKNILDFRFDGLLSEAIGIFDSFGNTITVNVPGETDVTHLVARFVLSPLAYAKVGGATQISGITYNDFTTPLQYTIVAEDNSEKIYTVRVIVGLYTGNWMTSFGFPDIPTAVAGVIDETAQTILVYVPFSISRQNLVATFTTSERSTVWIGNDPQASGVTVNDFNSVRTYTVKAENQTTRNYAVTVLKNPALNGNQILTFGFDQLNPPVGAVIDQGAHTITAMVPFGTRIDQLVATFTNSLFSAITIDGRAQVSDVSVNDYTDTLVYRCTSESGLYIEYLVTVRVNSGSNAKEISYFAFEDLTPVSIGTINQIERTILLDVMYGTPVQALRAAFVNSAGSTVVVPGKGVQVSGVSVNDYFEPVIYHVIAEDGTAVDYMVTVIIVSDIYPPIVTNPLQMVANASGQYAVLQTNEPTGKVYIIRSDAPQASLIDIEQSVISGLGRSELVTEANTEIRISTYSMEQGIYYTYASDAAGNLSLRGINSVSIIDVLAPDVYVQAQTISNARTRFVNVRSSDNSGFVYLIQEGMPVGTKQQLDAAVGALKAQRALVISAFVNTPVSTYQLLPGDYRAIAVDANGNLSAPSTSMVMVTQASHLNLVLAYGFSALTPPSIGQIVGTDISISVPVGTPLNALVGFFTLSPLAKAFVGLVEQNSGVTPNNFSIPVIYTIEAEDGFTVDYTVTVSFYSSVDNQEWLSRIRTYPNPFAELLMIEMTGSADRIEVLNSLGEVVRELDHTSSGIVTIDTGSWMKGVYFIRFFREGQFGGVKKVVKL